MASNESPKPVPPRTLTRLAADSLIETIDGPMEIVKLLGKTIPVLTRMPGGSLGFRMMTQIREIEADVPLLELRNSDGQVVVVGADHVFVAADGSEVRAVDLAAGARLESGWTYPAGYPIPDAEEYAPELRNKPFETPVLVRRCAEAGRGAVYGASVSGTKSYFLTFGALCRAQA
jgi:hypothetical protein